MSEYQQITSNSGLISFGNTGARLSDPRFVYYKILSLLDDFRTKNSNWDIESQVEFGKVLTENNVFNIRQDNIISSDKDVRLKTGFLSHFGFTDSNRRITGAGRELLNNYSNNLDNAFDISVESYAYFKQFLKYQQPGFDLIPLLSLIFCILEFDNKLPIDFVTYIWSGSHTKNDIISNIKHYKKKLSYKEALYKNIETSKNTEISKSNIEKFVSTYQMTNQDELKLLLCSILPHAKGDGFKQKAISLFDDMREYLHNKDQWDIEKKKDYIQKKLINRNKDISCKKRGDYLEFLFGCSIVNNTSDWEVLISNFDSTDIISSSNDSEFILRFHLLYMYLKKLSVCEEYRDLNIRHLKLLDIFVFDSDYISLDLLFWYIFKDVEKELLEVEVLLQEDYRRKLECSHSSIGDIYSFLDIDIDSLIERIAIEYPEVKKFGFKGFSKKRKEERLRKLANTVFTKDNIITLLKSIYPRNDAKIRKIIKELYIDYEATIPALFEYLLGMTFYWISKERINLSDVLQHNLDANLLPKTHISGGKSDLIVTYREKDYLIEATLSENDGQRRLEAEPVPRHLAKHILEINSHSMALFVAGQLDANNLVVLRNYKFSPWYSGDYRSINSMDIVPLSIGNIIDILIDDYSLDKLDNKLKKILKSDTKDGYKWYINEVNKEFSNGN